MTTVVQRLRWVWLFYHLMYKKFIFFVAVWLAAAVFHSCGGDRKFKAGTFEYATGQIQDRIVFHPEGRYDQAVTLEGRTIRHEGAWIQRNGVIEMQPFYLYYDEYSGGIRNPSEKYPLFYLPMSGAGLSFPSGKVNYFPK